MRRRLLEIVWHLNKQTDFVAAVVTAIYFLVLFIKSNAPVGVKNNVSALLGLAHPLHLVVNSLEVAVFLLIIAYWCVRFTFRNPNRRWLLVLNDTDVGRLKDWLSGTGKGSQLLESTVCKCQLANEAAMDELAKVNFNAFVGTAYAASLAEFKKRNTAFVTRNSKCFMLFIDPIEGKDLVGYSCLLPLTALGTRLYLEGAIADARLDAELIATEQEKPASILVFAVHLHPAFSVTKKGASRKYTLYFWSCIRHHIVTLCGDQLRSGMDFYVQTQERSLRRRLINKFGFVDEHKVSKDGYPILHRVVKVTADG